VTSIEPGTVQGTELALGRLGGDRKRLDELFEGYEYLNPEHIAEAIYWAASLPESVNINRIDMMATCQVFSNLTNTKQDSMTRVPAN
jgi:NADP-dependent 3-hydroxy acid dehydrogenase YdfG